MRLGEIANALRRAGEDAEASRRSEKAVPARPTGEVSNETSRTHASGPALELRHASSVRKTPATEIELPDAKAGQFRPATEVLTHPSSFASEQYRQLALRVSEALEKNGEKSVLITSATRGEGKSTTACNLALALSGLLPQSSVALVEFDLRGPVIAENLGFVVEGGIAEVLSGQVGLDDAVMGTNRGNLDIIPARQESAEAYALFAGRALHDVWEEILRRYDFVVVDGPPSLGFSDTSQLIRLADQCLMVARPSVTRMRALSAAVAELPQEKLLGVVTNASAARIHAWSSYYQYYDTVGVQNTNEGVQ